MNKRKKIIAGNWKMNTNLTEALALTVEIAGIYKDEVSSDVQLIICPPFISLAAVVKLLNNHPTIAVGAQNCHHESAGAYTGEVAASMISELGVKYIIIGHSERRQFAHEGNELLALKIRLALENSLLPIYCFGETQVERKSGEYTKVIRDQIKEGLFNLSTTDFGKVILAYEPVWAIGTGETATPKQANEIHLMVRNQIAEHYGETVAQNCSILYGGSVKPTNAEELFNQPDIDGGLIGGAALEARSFIGIVKAANA